MLLCRELKDEGGRDNIIVSRTLRSRADVCGEGERGRVLTFNLLLVSATGFTSFDLTHW